MQTEPTRAGTVPWPAEAAARYVAKGYWTGSSLATDVASAANRHPAAVAVVDGPTRLTYRELMARVDGAARRLRALGLHADDRIVVQLPNCWEFVVLTLACMRTGVVPVMALPAHRRHEMSYLAQHAQARALVVPESHRDFDHRTMADEVAARHDTVDHILVRSEGGGSLTELCEPAAKFDEAAPESSAVAVFLLSGGTTALPKLIARTHDDYAYYVRRIAAVCEFNVTSVNLMVLPMGHNFALGMTLATLLVGGRVVVSSPVPEPAFTVIERERVTSSGLVPAVVQRWLEHRRADGHHDISSLRHLIVGGSRLADHVAAQIRPILGCALQQGYGMAEGLVCMTRLSDGDEISCGTQGRPLSLDDELLVVDENGAPVPTGEPGELLTRGPYTPRGYYRAPEQNGRAFTADGWYRTGDIVRLRWDGNVVVEGREKDLINRGGEKVSAEEVENFAYQVDGVRAAAAVAMPDQGLGERVCLYVVTHDAQAVRLEDVRAVMTSAGVAAFKLPERLIIVDELPMTTMSKIDKKALRADIERRVGIDTGR